MIQRHVFRLATWTLGIAGVLVGSPSSRAEFFEFTSTATISDPTGGTIAGTTFTNGQAPPSTITLTGLPSQNLAIHSNAIAGTTISFGSIVANIDPNTALQPVAFNFSFLINLTDYSTSTSVVPTGTGSITVSGRFNGHIGPNQAINLGLPMVYATTPSNGIFTVGNTTYRLDSLTYSNPGPGGDPGTFGGTLTAVPEPASLAMLGLGSLGAIGMFRRRKAKATA